MLPPGELFDAAQVIDSMSFLYHLVPKHSWDKCKSHREAYYPPTYKQVCGNEQSLQLVVVTVLSLHFIDPL